MVSRGLWYVSRWPREFTSHDGRSGKREIINDGVRILGELAHWFFTGEPVAGGLGDD
jgi:hypothetical protein